MNVSFRDCKSHKVGSGPLALSVVSKRRVEYGSIHAQLSRKTWVGWVQAFVCFCLGATPSGAQGFCYLGAVLLLQPQRSGLVKGNIL